jgi:hypothetical protein
MCSWSNEWKRTAYSWRIVVAYRRPPDTIDSDERRCFGQAVCPGAVILACLCIGRLRDVSRVRSVGYIDGVGLARSVSAVALAALRTERFKEKAVCLYNGGG